MFKASGKLIYDPAPLRANFKARKEARWCAKVTAPKSIADYYRHWVQKELKLKLNFPIWDFHITAMRYSEPRNKAAWGKYEGETIHFEYDPVFKNNDTYFWLVAKCPRLEEIRTELGLPPQPPIPFHLTFGNTKNVTLIKPKPAPYHLFPWENT